ncbi:MAG: ATP-dependent 6-phosphofructokinase [Bacteroidales bacterium]|jgi:phosphofructokinase-like protein|nr:6-phosphofructokinase [Lentimicrobiaceae bacterium]MDG1135960.1 ATP-dependent 6-phosphofructokinase [Bacteroidales bacterium]MDG1902566.1 ATP-dependent 6-phosphofructokinase [Bacteroidales bacterium]MDG2080426.1 ATP-dependent 6-phosphofructokinase [Bacteroidales bacterium]|tara:strand:- start:9348 stop:10373 length:1026 start_codon:yes stop_codon:yes gene_type:complete
MAKPKKIGILTAGGDCPGLNAAIRGVGKTAIVKYGMEVIGISSGFSGLIDKEFFPLEERMLSGILTEGGTILGTSREKPFKKNKRLKVNKPEIIVETYNELGLDCLVCIGGNGTQKTAGRLVDEGLNIIGIPKTIDNDVWGTDHTFGFDSALWIATDAIDRLHSTANSHKRIMVIEVMGHHAGWLALYSGMAGGGDVILIPELEYNMDVVNDYLLQRARNKKPYSIVVVAEGIEKPNSDQPAASFIAKKIEEGTGIETRETILGYIQRGGKPTPMDRILATRFGASAVDLIAEGDYGKMVIKKGEKIKSIYLSEVGSKLSLVPPDHKLIKKARGLDICFGT